MSLEGKNIIITGAMLGVVVNWTTELSKEDASVFIGCRWEEKGMEVAKQQTNTTFHKVDVASEESNKEFFAATTKSFGGGSDDGSAVPINACVMDFILF